MEQTITVGLVEAFGIVVGIVGGITAATFALLVYFDKKNERRIDEVKTDMRARRREFKADIQEIQRNERTLTSKVDRIQGTLDVLVFGERIPEPVARERTETIGD